MPFKIFSLFGKKVYFLLVLYDALIVELLYLIAPSYTSDGFHLFDLLGSWTATLTKTLKIQLPLATLVHGVNSIYPPYSVNFK